MPPLTDPARTPTSSGQSYWRSLDHLANTAEFRTFMHREFPAGASELLDSDDRRHFLKIMGASMALAGMGIAGCRRWPEEQFAPYASRPRERTPGVPVQYATCFELGGVASGLLATSNDGRPTKLEGNPDHPASRGAADLLAQASLLGLYDVDRSREPRNEGEPSSWPAFLGWAGDHFKSARNKRGSGMAVLCEATASPSLLAQRDRLLERFPRARWYEYEPLNNDQEVAGSVLAFGRPYRVELELEQARTIVTLDADLLGTHRNAVSNIRGFARSRRADDHRGQWMSRLHAFESGFTVTGANADRRTAVRAADVALVTAWLAARILGDARLERLEQAPGADAVLGGRLREAAELALADLTAHRGKGVLVAGPRQPAEVHLLVHLMNQALGNVGSTVSYLAQGDQQKNAEAIRELVGKKLETLIIIGGNPVYNAPADVDFGAFLDGVGTTIHLADHFDETSERCTWHVNRAHYLETWGDGRAWDGTFSVAQPLIEPLFLGRSPIELLAVVNDDDMSTGRQIVERTFAEMVGGPNEEAWRRTLHDGYLSGSGYTRETPQADASTLAAAVDRLLATWSAPGDGWEIAFSPHTSIYDGRFANNGWCQEAPEPITRLTWDNAVMMSPAAAQTLGVEQGDLVRVGAGGRTVEAAVLVMPGLPERSVTLPLGYGRRFAGRISAGAGFDFYPLRTAETMGFATGATIEPIGGTYVLATTQDHHTIDVDSLGGSEIQNRLPTLFREASLEEYREHEDFAAHRTHVVHRLSQWEESNLEGAEYAWGMSIDLNSCVGCGACVVACQAENNIPIVGKDQVHRNREMHWLRVDRYFKFAHTADAEGHEAYDPNVVEAVALQPVPCMQCENAPCEQVCPVAATVHDSDGLNVMVYNRCVGTRYCANNCPYKVRRFNYFDYWRRRPYREQPGLLTVDESYFERPQATPNELRRLQLNPEVTVRMRGIMEKCTYCVQRIATAKIDAKNAYARLPEAEKQAHKDQRVAVPDGTITPACAQTCPAEAIVFGDLNDSASRVSKLQRHPRSYQMLEELNVEARTRYLAKLRNPGGGGGHGGSGGGHDDDHTRAPVDRGSQEEAGAHA